MSAKPVSPRPSSGNALLTSRDAAAAIGVGERTLRALRKDGLIAYVALTDRLIMYRPEDCADYLASRLRKDEPCPQTEPPPLERPRPVAGRRPALAGGNVISFEQLAAQRGWS